MDESEMLAIMEACKHWRHYLEGATYKVCMITNYYNLHTFLITKNLTHRETRRWEQLSGLDMEIKYHSEKKNPTDGPSQHPNYIDAANKEAEKIIYIMGYVTWGSIKYGKTQKAIENVHQAIQQSEITSEADTSESHFTDNKSLLYDTVDDCAKISSLEGSDVSDSNPIKMRRTFSKHKHKESTNQAKRVLSKGRKKKKLDKISLDSQPMRLHLMTHNNKMAYINCEAVKKIFKKESTFASPSLKMRQVFQALQKADHFVQTMKLCAIKTGLLAPQRKEEEKMSILVKSDEFEKTMMWHMKDKLLCYKQRWYVPLGFLRWELLRQHHDNPWADNFDPCRALDLLQRHYYWPQMLTEVQEYMNACHACKFIKLK